MIFRRTSCHESVPSRWGASCTAGSARMVWMQSTWLAVARLILGTTASAAPRERMLTRECKKEE
jgi:hypothetical protein